MNFKHTLDPTPRKFPCPSCGKKRFVRYINTQTGEYLPIEYGRCDRETSCAYHHKPERRYSPSGGGCESLQRGRGRFFPTNKYPQTGGGLKEPATNNSSNFDTIVFPTFRATLPNQKQNHFVQYLKTLFPRETVKKLIINFFIGASNHWPGATIFWQIDKNEKIRSGQVILFDKETGKRIKKPYPHITWVHSLLIKQGKFKNYNLEQCLFGEHQLIFETNNKSVALVESAKTAIIMTGFYPNYIWMATNGSSNLNSKILKPLLHRNIILYPDLGQFEKWNGKAIDLQKQGFKVTVSNLLETNATPDDHKSGLDIADYFINSPFPKGGWGDSLKLHDEQREPVLAVSKDDTLFNSFAIKYPSILNLVDALDLINPNTNKPFHNATTL